MSSTQQLILGEVPSAGVVPAQQISRSLRFNSADSAYLNRTPASASNRKTWTWSGWVKRSKLSGSFYFFCGNSAASNAGFFGINFEGADRIEVTGWTTVWRSTSAQYRDPSAWYHIVVALDTTQATADNRVRVYVNGSEVTAFATKNNPTQNDDLGVNTAAAHYISSYDGTNSDFDGYLADVYFIDGQALTPSSFGQTNSATGVWEPIAYTGTYGTNGFYVNFSDNSNTTSTTLGKDYSGNGNNWTPSAGFSVAAGAGNDSLVDTPTPYGTDTGVGGEVRGNYCTLSPLQSNGGTLSNGNLDYATSTSTVFYSIGTIGVPSGKWYFEVRRNSGNSAYPFACVFKQGGSVGSYLGSTADAWTLLMDGNDNGKWRTNGTLSTNRLSDFVDGDIAMVAVDVDAGKVWFGRNGTWAESGAPASGTNAQYTNLSGTIAPAIAMYNAAGVSVNFGQRAFSYTAPSGFKALCTQNLPTPTIGATATTRADDYFNTVLYTGTGSSLSVTGVGFQPDWTWIKSRSAATDHGLYDAVRGVQKQLESNNTDAETTETTGLTAFNSDGFTVGALAQLNTNTATYVGWNWKANGAGSSNTAGSIQSTVSANTTAGFSVVTYTGNGTSGATVGHGCLVNGSATTPSMVMIHRRDAVSNWQVKHVSLNANQNLELNSTAAVDTAPGSGYISAISSTTLTLLNGGSAITNVNANTGTYVVYCFAPVAGYSAFGSYTGNGSADGPFVYTGFRPRYVMLKASDRVEAWYLFDTARNPYNVADNRLYANTSGAEGTGGSYGPDILSNGFKLRTSDSGFNFSGATYVYACFAENPFKYSLAR